MERYQVILAYDGSKFKGFQRQVNARSVQGAVEDSLRKLGWQGKSILAAGRTDTGAHATGQVIAFDLAWEHSPQELQLALNDHLPDEVVAREVRQVGTAFHPRYDASWRKYQYRLYCQAIRQPLLEPYAWRVWPPVDLNTLVEAARQLVGTHDFQAFGTPPQSGGGTVRMVLQADWKQEMPYFTFEITAQAFLYHMVRRLAFVQVHIAQGKLSLDYFKRAITGEHVNHSRNEPGSLSTTLIHGLAPAKGLILAEVHYPSEALGLAEDPE